MTRLTLVTLIVVAVIALTACIKHAQPIAGKPPHHTAQGFVNPQLGPLQKSFFDYIGMRYFSDEVFADHEQDADQMAVVASPQDLKQRSASQRISWLGHSTFLVQTERYNILTDPILSKRASPVSFAGPRRLVPMPIDYDDLPRIDYVVISHDHYDHLDKTTVLQLANAPTYLVPLGLKQWFVDVGIDPAKVIELDWWQTFRTDRVTFTATPSQHWSGRGLFDREQTLWAAWHIDIEDFSVWFAGDTGYNDFQFKAVAERWGGVDLALIPIGSYAPRWFMQKHHVNPEEAIRIHQDVNARLSIGMHWGTFQLSAEPMMEPQQRLQQLIAENGLSRGEFVTLAIGESITLNGRS